MPETIQETYADFCRRQKAGLLIVGEQQQKENDDQEALRDIHEKRYERKYDLFFDNLDLILRHREEILATPRYANIDAHYALGGGGLYVGELRTARQFNIAGTLVTFNLKLGTVLKIWDTDQFRARCECGETAVIRHFVGSPLSGGSNATAVCPKCKKKTHVANRSFGMYYFYVKGMLDDDIEMVVKNLIVKWTVAEVEHQKKVAEGKCRDPKIAQDFKGDKETCSLETMLQELRLKEFKESGNF